MTYLDSQIPSVDPGPDKGKDKKKPTGRLRKYWREIEAYGKTSTTWKEQAEKIVKMYLDQHRTAASSRRFALLWSNIETLKPAVYGKLPTALCSRRYKDPHPVGRVAAEILERATNTTFDLYNVDEVFRMVRDDRLLTARGTAWVRYEADFKQADGYDKVAGERACVDYVHWDCFGHNVAGTWKDVWLVWRKVEKSREEAEEKFGKDIAKQLSFSNKPDPDGKEEKSEPTACVYEVWDKKLGKMCFISRDVPELFGDGDPPINFRDFFPCPEPCYGSKTGKSLIPTPDYRYYQDQAMEIDDLTEKIASLTDLLIMRGFVAVGPSADGGDAARILIQSLQSGITSNKNIVIPVESWAGFTDKGGAKAIIDWMPTNIVIEALKGAIEARNQLVQDVYQITGIADILRGQTDPDETLGAQELKAQTGQRRVRNCKDELARFCKDIARLVAEVIAEQFQPQTIASMTGFAYDPMAPVGDPKQEVPGAPASPPGAPGKPPAPANLPGLGAPMQPGMPQGGNPGLAPGAQLPMQMAPASGAPARQSFNDEVIALLRSDRMRSFLIDIETDSTIQPDEDAEKQRRTEFITAVGGFVKEAAQVLPMAPALAPVISESLLFMVRGFRAGRNLEETIEKSMQQLQVQLAQPRPDPEMQKLQMQMQADQQKAQVDIQMKQADLQIKQAELQLKEREMEMKLQMEQQKAQFEMQVAQIESQSKMQIAQQESDHKAQLAAQEANIKQQAMQEEARRKAEQGQQEFVFDQQMRQQEFGSKQAMAAEAHGLKMKQADQAHKAEMKRADEIDRAAGKARIDHEGEIRKAKASEPRRSRIVNFLKDKNEKITGAEVH